jgi:predicted secreted protein
VIQYSNCYQMVESLQSFITDMKKQKFQLAFVSQSPSDGSFFITSSCSKENNEIHHKRSKLKIEYEYAQHHTFDILSESESEPDSENLPFLW